MVKASEPLPLLPLTTVGSHPRPSWWYLANEAIREGRFGPQDQQETFDHAVELAILEQERLGLDVITDGEMWRPSGYVQSLFGRIQGLSIAPATARRWGPPHYDMDPQIRVTGPVSAPEGLGIAEHFPRLRERATHRVKVTCPGPLTFARHCCLAPPYSDMWELGRDFAKIVNAELKACVAAGADFVQIDEPSVGVIPGEGRGMAELINLAVEGVDAKIALHVCFGNNRGRPRVTNRRYRPLFPALLEARVDQFLLEFANRQMADIDLWQQYRPRQELVVGVIDQKAYMIETPEVVAERIRTALQYVPAEQLWISPDCGLSSTPYWIGLAKLQAMVEGTLLVRRELEGR
jgi:5-methyltetrahydropteroyltriglutamate--homocysteine methyltransferase